MRCKTKILTAVLTVALIAATGCSATEEYLSQESAASVSSEAAQTETENSSETANASSAESKTVSATNTAAAAESGDLFTDRDLDPGYDASEAVSVTLADGASKCDSDGVTIDGDTITITKEGVYVLSGTLTNGQIIVDTEQTAKVQLVLNGVTVNCDTSAAVYVKQADKVFLTLAKGTANKLSNKEDFVAIDDNDIDAVIFSKDDLTCNGSGTLEVSATYGHGIVSKDDLKITGGTYQVTAAGHALSANDSVRLKNADLTLTAGKDGIQAENTEDTALGYFYMESGAVRITAEGDGIDASGTAEIKDGTVDITSGGGASNAETKQEQFGKQFRTQQEAVQSDSSAASAKGIKADGGVQISGGTVTLNCADDALHSNTDVTVSGGTITVQTGDDGVHADNTVTIQNGSVKITKSHEGLEGQVIDISGGEISVVADDDGLNASGGSDQSGVSGGMIKDEFAVQQNSVIRISGGKITIDASGDGVDSNGSIEVTGGETYVAGPENSGNGAMDYNGTATITGGTFIATGAGGMEQNFSDGSTQGAMLVSVGGSSGEVTLLDSDGSTIVSFDPGKTYGSVLISAPQVQSGKTYTVQSGGSATSVEMTGTIYGGGSSMGGGGAMNNRAGMGGDFGGRGAMH